MLAKYWNFNDRFMSSSNYLLLGYEDMILDIGRAMVIWIFIVGE